ncbi:MAG: hypothetical protein ACLQU3_18375 [Limisphaerales bacterium]
MSMNDNELEHLEAQLRSVSPARPPADFLQRLKSNVAAQVAERRAQTTLAAPPAQPGRTAAPETVRASEAAVWSNWPRLVLRWLVPAAAVMVVGAIIWRANLPAGRGPETASAPVKADDVQIDQQLVSTFDAVAQLPSGEPVRFRCREWIDEVVLRDSRRGVEVARRVPRVEVVPVPFETY